MKIVTRVLLILLCGSCALQCQSAIGTASKQALPTSPQERDLSVEAKIVAQSYCHVDDEAFSVRMEVKLNFTNSSDQPIVMARRIESPPIVRVAKKMRDALNGNFEYDPRPDFIVSELPQAPPFGERPDPKYFITLAPKKSYEVGVVTGVIGATRASKARRDSGLLAKGAHLLELGVSTWPYEWPYFDSKTDVKKLSQRWSRYGHLANGLVYSNFVPFTIPEQFVNPPCASPGKR